MAPFWRPSLDRFEDRKLSQNTANHHPHEPSSSTSPPLFSFDDIGGLVPPSHEEITDLALVQDLERGARREATDGDQGANALITLNADHNERSNVAIIIFAIERALNALLRALFILAGNLERLIRDLLRCYDWYVASTLRSGSTATPGIYYD